MKNNKKDYITHYAIEENNIIIYYKSGHINKISYNREKEKELLELLKNNYIKDLEKQQRITLSDNTTIKENIKLITKLWLFDSKYKEFRKTIASIGGARILITLLFLIDTIIKICTLERIKDIEKKKFFFENESIINQEILKRYLEEHKDQTQEINIDEAPVININDLYFMTIQELEEIVENIKNRNNSPSLKLN